MAKWGWKFGCCDCQPCMGDCTWEWDNELQRWTLLSSTCEDSCNCGCPEDMPLDDGDQVTTPCYDYSVYNCGLEANFPECFVITVAGVTNDDCSRCNAYNGTFILTRQESPSCTWSYTQCQDGCSGSGNGTVSGWSLAFNSVDGEFQLTAVGSVAVYTIAYASFDPEGDTVLTLDTTSSACGDWPATITVSPSTDCFCAIDCGTSEWEWNGSSWDMLSNDCVRTINGCPCCYFDEPDGSGSEVGERVRTQCIDGVLNTCCSLCGDLNWGDAEFEVTIASISGCPDGVGTFTIDNPSTIGCWSKEDITQTTTCCGHTPGGSNVLRLFMGGGSPTGTPGGGFSTHVVVFLQAGATNTVVARWLIPIADFDCQGSNVFSLDTFPTCSGNAPSTITVERSN